MDESIEQGHPDRPAAEDSELARLVERVTSLEHHMSRLAQDVAAGGTAPTHTSGLEPAHKTDPPAAPSSAKVRQPSPLDPRGLSLAAYLGASVVKASDALLEYDRAARAGQADLAAVWAEQVAEVSCVGLSRVLDEVDFESGPPGMERENQYLSAIRTRDHASASTDVGAFRDAEMAILQLIGLSDELAARMVDDLTQIYASGSGQSQGFGQRADQALRSVCALHEQLVAKRHRVEARPPGRRRKKLWTAVMALGGGALYVGNATAGALLGGGVGAAVGVAASQHIGASAWDMASVYLRDG